MDEKESTTMSQYAWQTTHSINPDHRAQSSVYCNGFYLYHVTDLQHLSVNLNRQIHGDWVALSCSPFNWACLVASVTLNPVLSVSRDLRREMGKHVPKQPVSCPTVCPSHFQ